MSEPAADIDREARELFERYVEEHVTGGAADLDRLSGGRPELRSRLEKLVAAYHAVDEALSRPTEPAPVVRS